MPILANFHYVTTMNPRKPNSQHAVSSGISLPPSLKAANKKIAKKRGLTLSAFTVAVFTEIVNAEKARSAPPAKPK